MSDMLVKLYELSSMKDEHEKMLGKGITIRPVLPAERHLVLEFVKANFSQKWADETAVAIARQPMGCHIAYKDKKIIGFSCWGVVAREFFGPMGVLPEARKLGVGKSLLLSCLHAMHDYGFGYAIIGSAGPTEFYKKTCGAQIIEGSAPGVFKGMLKE